MSRAKLVGGPPVRLACALRCLLAEHPLDGTRPQALPDAHFHSRLLVLTLVTGSGWKVEHQLSGFRLSLSAGGMKEVF